MDCLELYVEEGDVLFTLLLLAVLYFDVTLFEGLETLLRLVAFELLLPAMYLEVPE